MKNIKLYPFNVQKHAHDIEFLRNRTSNIMSGMESDEIQMNGAEYNKLSDRFDALTDLLLVVIGSQNGRMAYLTGKQIGLAKEAVLWAAETRANTIVSKRVLSMV